MDHSDNAQCWCFPASNGSHRRSHRTNPDASVWNACAPATFCSCVNNVLNGFWVNSRSSSALPSSEFQVIKMYSASWKIFQRGNIDSRLGLAALRTLVWFDGDSFWRWWALILVDLSLFLQWCHWCGLTSTKSHKLPWIKPILSLKAYW